ncbi:MAG: hypothetical protein ACYTFG_13580, partial [Planctomycetota bacterium]
EGQGGDPFIIAQALGALAIVKKRDEEGEKKFLESIDAFPVAFELWNHVGLARLLSGNKEGAVAEFLRLMSREDEPLFQRLRQLAPRTGD